MNRSRLAVIQGGGSVTHAEPARIGAVTASRWAVCWRCGDKMPERRIERGTEFWFSRERHDCKSGITLDPLVEADDDALFGDGGVA